jgi:hypothetical protein
MEQGPILLQSKEIKPDTESAENYHEEVAEQRNQVLRRAQKNLWRRKNGSRFHARKETRFW